MAKKIKSISEGMRTVKQLLNPSSITLTSEHELKVDYNYVRSFVINGYPSMTSVGWLNTLYNSREDMDVAICIEPSHERTAIDELTDKIVEYESQLITEVNRGSIKNVTELNYKISALYEERSKLERNFEKMYHVSITYTLFHHHLKELNKISQKLQSKLMGSSISALPLFLRQVQGFLSTSPFGVNQIPDYYRNMNTSSVSDLNPFYNPEINHGGGTFIGSNISCQTPVFVDFFNKKILPNANFFVSGMSGAGKTYLVSLLIFRSLLEGIKSVVLDPEGEYGGVTRKSGGQVCVLAPGSQLMMNPFDIDEEVELNDAGEPTGRIYVDVKGKVADLLNLFGIMFPDLMGSDFSADLSDALLMLYAEFGITENPASLYQDCSYYDEATGQYYHDKVFKVMPRMSDCKRVVEKYAKDYNSPHMSRLANAMKMYTEGGIYDMFDCYSTINYDYEKTPVLTFDLSKIEDEILRPIAMHVAITWSWSKFVKRDLKTKKRIIADEAWMMLKKAMAGSRFSALFLEKCARRIRKYNGSLGVASQSVREFIGCEEGLAILSSSPVKIFFKHDAQDMAQLSERFILTEGEKNFLLSAKTGEALMKINRESARVRVMAFDFENEIISRKFLQ